MKKTTKLLSLLLAVVMLIGMVPLAASAEANIGSVGLAYHFANGQMMNYQPQVSAIYTATKVEWEAAHDGQPFSNNECKANKFTDWAGYIMTVTLKANSGYKFSNSTTMFFNGVKLDYRAPFNAENQYNVYNSGGNNYLKFTVTFRYLEFNLAQYTTAETENSIVAYTGFYIGNEIINAENVLPYDAKAHFSYWDSDDVDMVDDKDLTTDIKMHFRHNSVIEAYYTLHDLKESVVAPKANALGYTAHSCACGYVQKENFVAQTGKVAGFKCAARTQAAEKFTWNKMTGVTGYQIQISNAAGNAWGKAYATTANSYLFKGLSAGSNYKFRIRTYIKASDGKNYFGPWAALASPTLPAATTVKASAAKKAFTATWAKKAVTGYQLQYSTKANFAGAKTITIKNAKTAKYTVKNLKAKTTYYVRVRTYKTIAKVNYFSTWSTAKVKTK